MFFSKQFAYIRDNLVFLDREVSRVKGVAIKAVSGIEAVDARVAKLEKTVEALRTAHNELYQYDVAKRFQVDSGPITLWYDALLGALRHNEDKSYVATLAKTSPRSEPIQVKPAKAARKR